MLYLYDITDKLILVDDGVVTLLVNVHFVLERI